MALGKLADCEHFRQQYDSAFAAMGDPDLRLMWLERLEQAGYELPVLIHPRACVSPSAVLECGSMVEAMAVVEKGSLLCAGCVVNHNARVQAGRQIDCNAVVASHAVVPRGTKVPSGTVFERK